ncbi:MAG TPA: RNA polymerase sigma factor [Chitinophagales bacterium]|nr:RNA polymerase sigma factor [Chitinophagales bacterium]
MVITANFPQQVVNLSGSLKPFAFNLTKDMDEAKDLLQETIYRALVNQEKYAEGTNLKAWLFTIMKNIFINTYRKKSKQRVIVDTTDNLYFINSFSTVIPNSAEKSLMYEDAMDAIAKLSADYRVPFMMHYNGFKYQEIADDLQLPLGTVKSRIFFARKALKDRLPEYADSFINNNGSIANTIYN